VSTGDPDETARVAHPDVEAGKLGSGRRLSLADDTRVGLRLFKRPRLRDPRDHMRIDDVLTMRPAGPSRQHVRDLIFHPEPPRP